MSMIEGLIVGKMKKKLSKSPKGKQKQNCDEIVLLFFLNLHPLRACMRISAVKVTGETYYFFFRFFEKFWLGGAAPRCPPDPPVFGWGGKAPPNPPSNGRSSHLIEAAKRGRLDQMIFFSAPLTIRAPPTTVRRPSDNHPTTSKRCG